MAHTSGRFDTHPSFDRVVPDWLTASDCYEGERAIKEAKEKYLPITSGQRYLGLGTSAARDVNGDYRKPGQQLYDAYVARAVFPDLVRQTTEALVGTMLRAEWSINLPDAMMYLLERASARRESLGVLITRILRMILLYGRVGLLNEVRPGSNEVYIADYHPVKIINWDDNPEGGGTDRQLRAVVLDESRLEINDNGRYSWDRTERYRVVRFDDAGKYIAQLYSVQSEPTEILTPSLQGEELDYLPFTFCGSVDMTPEPDEVPMLALARIALTIYRTEADYRQALFMSGQDTLVIHGMTAPQEGSDAAGARGQIFVGSGSTLYFEGPPSEAGANYVGVNSQGLPETRQALENDYVNAQQFGLALLTSGSQGEAAETLKTRVAGRTATLGTIVRTAAAALQQQLRWAAAWAGENPEDVLIEPSTDFAPAVVPGSEINQLIAAKFRGMPFSWSTIHDNARRGGITKHTLEEEMELIADEEPLPDPGRGEPEGDPPQGE